jgi:diguanylate cyclase (GGDEF)-like protein
VEIPTPDGPLTVAGLTASLGAAVHPGHGDELTALMQAADTALYAAKRAGRNTVRLASAPPSAALSNPEAPA